MKILGILIDLFSRPLVLSAIALIVGIMFGLNGNVLILVAVIMSGIFGIAAGIRAKYKTIRLRRIITVIIALFFMLVGIIRVRDISFDSGSVPEFDGACKGVQVTGTVKDISISGESYVLTVLNPELRFKNEEEIISKDTHIPEGIEMIIYSDILSDISIGDIILSKGTLYSFSKATNYGQFDQKKYYTAKNIYYKLYSDEIVTIKNEPCFKDKIKNLLFNISSKFQNGLNKIFGQKEKGVLSAMLAGNRSELDEKTKEVYQRIGIAHILSISGLHITLIGMAVFGFLIRICGHLKFSVFFSLSVIFLYGYLTGFSVSTERAVIMLTSLLAARIAGEAYDGQSAAAFAAIIILIINPLQLYESGFLLSFFAVFGIFAGNEIRNNLNIKNKFMVYIIPGFFAQIATFPIILSTYYSFSPYSFLANLILLPFMTIIVVSGFLAGIFGMLYNGFHTGVFLDLGMITGGPADFLLKIYENASEKILSLPGSDQIIGQPCIWACVIYYFLLFMMVYISSIYLRKCFGKVKNEKDNNRISGLIIRPAFFTILVIMIFTVTIRGRSSRFFSANIDVGQGLSIFIESDGKKILADGGSSNIKNVGKYRIEPFLLWYGISELDYCFVSHTDEDHISGIRDILEDGRIKIKNMIFSEYTDKEDKLVLLALEKGVNVEFAEKGDVIRSSKDDKSLNIEVLSPSREVIYEDKNQASMVLRISKAEFSMLITGDSDIYAEAEYIDALKKYDNITVLQCPHHGSKYSCSEYLLNTIRPGAAIISCSKHNKYGHPAKETLDRLNNVNSRIYTTPECGMITVEYDEDGKCIIKRFINKN